MVGFFPANISARSRKALAVYLAFTWFTGLILGTVTALSADASFYSLMRRIPEFPVSIVSLSVSLLFPLLLSAVAFYVSQRWLLILIAFCKALVFAILSSGIAGAYGAGGWLVAPLSLFSDFLAVPLLLWLWLSSLKQSVSWKPRCIILFLAFLLISFLDYQFVSPFLINLLSI